jgi:hypothetical protein
VFLKEIMKAHYQHLQAEHASISDLKAYSPYTINPRERVITNLRTSRITPFAQQHGELLIGMKKIKERGGGKGQKKKRKN